eukprot:403349710
MFINRCPNDSYVEQSSKFSSNESSSNGWGSSINKMPRNTAKQCKGSLFLAASHILTLEVEIFTRSLNLKDEELMVYRQSNSAKFDYSRFIQNGKSNQKLKRSLNQDSKPIVPIQSRINNSIDINQSSLDTTQQESDGIVIGQNYSKGMNKCNICLKPYKKEKEDEHYLYRCMQLPLKCSHCGITKIKFEMDMHIYKDCEEFIICCRLCGVYYRRKDQSTHVCISKEQNIEQVLMLQLKQMKDQNIQLNLQNQSLRCSSDKNVKQQSEFEEDIAKLKRENDELNRRMETMSQIFTNNPTQLSLEPSQQIGSFIQGSQFDNLSINCPNPIDVDKIKFDERFAYMLQHQAAITQIRIIQHQYLGTLMLKSQFALQILCKELMISKDLFRIHQQETSYKLKKNLQVHLDLTINLV